MLVDTGDVSDDVDELEDGEELLEHKADVVDPGTSPLLDDEELADVATGEPFIAVEEAAAAAAA